MEQAFTDNSHIDLNHKGENLNNQIAEQPEVNPDLCNPLSTYAVSSPFTKPVNSEGHQLTCDDMKAPHYKTSNSSVPVPSVEQNCYLVQPAKSHYLCEVCAKSFNTSSELNFHRQQEHAIEKPYKCEICSKSFYRADGLRIHFLHFHPGEKPYLCRICSKSFAASHYLKKHLRLHSEERPYSCEICSKSYVSSYLLKVHHRVHTGEKPYKCKMCIKSFFAPSQLKRHIPVHTGEKLFTCKICSKSFPAPDNLQKHHRRVNSQREPILCDVK